MTDVVATLIQHAQDGNRIGHVQQRDTRGHDTVGRGRRSMVKQTKATNDEAAHRVSKEHTHPDSMATHSPILNLNDQHIPERDLNNNIGR